MMPAATVKRAPQKKPDPKRQEQGRQNRAEGKEFEKRIDEAFAYCKSKGSAQIDKTPEPTKVIKRLEGGKFIAVFDKKAQPDYSGTLKGGRSVKFEAKFTTSDRITADRVTDTQADYLAKAAALGAHCYILAGFSTGNVYKIPWEIWSEMKSYFGRKYVQEADLKQYQVNAGWHGMLMII